MKCSGARDTRKGIKPCGRLVKPEKFDAFCSEPHREDALTFAGQDAFNRHLQHFRAVANSGDKSLIKAFNDTARPMFVSMLEAQKAKLKERYMNTVCAEYAQGVRNAWENVGLASGDDSAQVLADLQHVQERRQSFTKRKSYESLTQLLFGGVSSSLLLTDGRDSSFSSKKSRTESVVSDVDASGYTVDEPQEVQVDPTKVALPDDDDDWMSE